MKCIKQYVEKELKKYNIPQENIVFEDKARKYLIKQGFEYISPFEESLLKEPYFVWDTDKYVLENYIQAETADLCDKKTLIAAAENLARFHKASEGFFETKEKVTLGRIPETYEKRYVELIKIRKKISSGKGFSPMELVILKNYDYIMDRLKQAKDIMNSDCYRECEKKVRHKGMLCHNNYKGDNIRITPSGKIVTTGLSKCAVDTNVTDLSEFIRRYMKLEEYEDDMVLNIIDAYGKIYPLDKNDLETLRGMLIYPYKFLKICNEYFNKRRVCVSQAAVEKLEDCIKQYKRSEKIPKKLEAMTAGM